MHDSDSPIAMRRIAANGDDPEEEQEENQDRKIFVFKIIGVFFYIIALIASVMFLITATYSPLIKTMRYTNLEWGAVYDNLLMGNTQSVLEILFWVFAALTPPAIGLFLSVSGNKMGDLAGAITLAIVFLGGSILLIVNIVSVGIHCNAPPGTGPKDTGWVDNPCNDVSWCCSPNVCGSVDAKYCPHGPGECPNWNGTHGQPCTAMPGRAVSDPIYAQALRPHWAYVTRLVMLFIMDLLMIAGVFMFLFAVAPPRSQWKDMMKGLFSGSKTEFGSSINRNHSHKKKPNIKLPLLLRIHKNKPKTKHLKQ